MKKTHDYAHYYRGYWSDGGKCRIRIYQEDGRLPLVICSQLPENGNTSVTNMAEYLAAQVIEAHHLPVPLVWVEHYPEHEGGIGEWSLVRFSPGRSRRFAWGHVASAGRVAAVVIIALRGVRRPNRKTGRTARRHSRVERRFERP